MARDKVLFNIVKIYLDNSVLNRPFDDCSQPRVWLETICFIFILQMIEGGEAVLIRSSIHELENRYNPQPQRQRWVANCLRLARITIKSSPAIRLRASSLRLSPVDALHAAAAEQGKADYFLTCDDKLARRYHGMMRVLTPPEFVLLFFKELP